MKIIIFRTFPSILDPEGYNIQEIGFAKALVRAGHTCDVILFNGLKENEIKEIDVFNDGNVVGKITIYMRKGIGILKNGFFPVINKIVENYNLIQVHEYDQISSWMYYAWYRKKPVVIYHGPYYDAFNKGYNFKCKIFDKTFLKLKNSSQTLCFTKSKVAAKFLEGKGFKNTIPIGVGLDVDNFALNTENAENGSEQVELPLEIVESINNKWNAVYVGKIEPRRNSIMLLDVIKQVSEQCEDIHFTIVGSGDDKEYVTNWKDKAQRFIDNGVLTYVERLSQQQIKMLYEKMQVMVFPSNYEIFGMVLLEAMYFNLPVISSDNGGSDTLITGGEDGIIVNGFEVSDWSKSIIELYENKNRYEAIKSNLVNKNHAIYTWDGIVATYLKALKDNNIIDN